MTSGPVVLGPAFFARRGVGGSLHWVSRAIQSSHEAVLRRLCWSTISRCVVCQPQDLQLSSLQACVGSSLLSRVTKSSTEIQHSVTRFCLNHMWICSAMISHCLALWVVGNGRMLSFCDLQKTCHLMEEKHKGPSLSALEMLGEC